MFDKEICPKCHGWHVYSLHLNHKWRIACETCGLSTEWHDTWKDARNEWTERTAQVSELISLKAVNEWKEKLINELELIFSDIREKNVDDSVCGLCEYDCDHGIDGFANECPGFEKDDCFKLKDSIREEWTEIKNVSTVPVIPIPDNATNGDVIKALFPKVVAKQHITSLSLTEVMRAGIDCDVYTSKYKFFTLWFPSEWWNAPYKGGDTE